MVDATGKGIKMKDYECHVVDGGTVLDAIWERARMTINPHLCWSELNPIVTFQWKLLFKELFQVNTLKSILLCLGMK